jgi:hypothetical protein
VTEERGTYDLNHAHPDHTDGIERLGDILHRLIDHRGWRPLLEVTPTNGHHAGTDDESPLGDG